VRRAVSHWPQRVFRRRHPGMCRSCSATPEDEGPKDFDWINTIRQSEQKTLGPKKGRQETGSLGPFSEYRNSQESLRILADKIKQDASRGYDLPNGLANIGETNPHERR